MATDLKFNEIIKELNEVHDLFPDLRFGQVMQNAIDNFNLTHNANLNDLSSKKIFLALQDFKERTKKQRGIN